MNEGLFVGLMSGTSVDAIDSALVQCRGNDCTLLTTHSHPLPQAVRKRVADISHSGPDEIEQLGVLDRDLGTLFAEATLALLATAALKTTEITAIGSHGQTIRHRPPSASAENGPAFTLQIGDPNTIAETTGITTVADFRRRDVAAGGEGAPLAPAFHAAAMAAAGCNRAIVNIGGIANVSLLHGTILLRGFDTGPGNTLLDHWIDRHRGEHYDADGRWSAQGRVSQPLLDHLLQHPHLALAGPRSTGKEAFNLAWLDNCLVGMEAVTPVDVQATLAEFTAATIAGAIREAEVPMSEVYICGGGAHNSDLMARLQRMLAPATLHTTAALGIDPDWVEAATFAWLASRTLAGLAGNAPTVTGATGERVLGGVYPGS